MLACKYSEKGLYSRRFSCNKLNFLQELFWSISPRDISGTAQNHIFLHDVNTWKYTKRRYFGGFSNISVIRKCHISVSFLSNKNKEMSIFSRWKQGKYCLFYKYKYLKISENNLFWQWKYQYTWYFRVQEKFYYMTKLSSFQQVLC